jgi:Fe-S cluster biogenesis protein NfuA
MSIETLAIDTPPQGALADKLDAALVNIRARLRGHIGDVVVADATDGVVKLDFLGACRGCPAQAFTFLAVVEPALLAVEGVKHVEPPRSTASPAVVARIRDMISSCRV